MFKRNLTSLAVGAMLAMGAASAYALTPGVQNDVARESAEGPRGADNERPGDRQRRGGSGLIDLPGTDVVAAKGSGRGKPRVPGGSGCDDPQDVIEHPECAGNAAAVDEQLARRKPRVPGGSGCDDPEDVIEHPECRLGAITSDKQFVAREASEGPRGADNERPGDRQRRGGRGLTTDTPADQLIVRSKPRVPGGSGCDDPEDVIEHPECRLGATVIDVQFVAREASEGPRGADNERPGDRHRRGGRGHG